MENVRRGLLELGATPDQIVEIIDADFKTLSKDIFQHADGFASAKWYEGQQKTLIFVYYAGHGIM